MENKIIQNVQDSFQKVQPVSEQALAIFYPKSFKKRISLGALLNEGMKEQEGEINDDIIDISKQPGQYTSAASDLRKLRQKTHRIWRFRWTVR